MTTGNSGAVFFLGSRAHYQVLTPPSSQSYDIENGNTSTETIYQNTSTENIYNSPTNLQWPNNLNSQPKNSGNFLFKEKEVVIDMPQKNKEYDYGEGVKRRLNKYRKQDGSSELILNDNEEVADMNPSDLNDINKNNNNSEKQQPKQMTLSRPRSAIAYLLSILTRRKRNAAREEYQRQLETTYSICSYRDSCRCDDCQSRYFECDESDEEYTISEDSGFSPQYSDYSAAPQNEYSPYETPPQYTEYAQYLQECNECSECSVNCRECSPDAVVQEAASPPDSQPEDDDEDDDEEVFITSPPAPPPAYPAVHPAPPVMLTAPAPLLSTSSACDEDDGLSAELDPLMMVVQCMLIQDLQSLWNK